MSSVFSYILPLLPVPGWLGMFFVLYQSIHPRASARLPVQISVHLTKEQLTYIRRHVQVGTLLFKGMVYDALSVAFLPILSVKKLKKLQ